ncbi:Transcriptional regulator (Transcriptional regulator, arac-family) [Bradyrhizobium sp. ORS 375]|uniref:AraC family transcriptional regulator n=1 Tax=Bradyrhizobium sp. (strain ORS 375) TaxID=566679 RepID=UPI000240967C|nr:AraC family transcriptional regulator [Bradyrhizobium sp. ORS 375]CCD93357.1 Transcriptional regulator (Transcriptional regulator, arac-family) [Bradyrhizobium sp. ORS 375]
MDPLTQVVRLLKPRALLWKQLDTRGRWAIRYPSIEDTVFCLAASGRCRLQIHGRPARTMETGDFLLMSEPPEWLLGDSENTPPIRFQAPPSNPFSRSIVSDESSTAPSFRLLGGRFSFDRTHIGLLRDILPSIVEIPFATTGAGRVAGLLKMLETESWQPRPGSSLVVERLLEILLVEVIRHQGGDRAGARNGLLAGLSDPQLARALHAMHDDAARDWTVESLARTAGLSRSVFAHRFGAAVGVPPMQYLLTWRMALAKEMIGAGASIAEVAFACGYQSASSFSVAFNRSVGCPPSYMRQAVRKAH